MVRPLTVAFKQEARPKAKASFTDAIEYMADRSADTKAYRFEMKAKKTESQLEAKKAELESRECIEKAKIGAEADLVKKRLQAALEAKAQGMSDELVMMILKGVASSLFFLFSRNIKIKMHILA